MNLFFTSCQKRFLAAVADVLVLTILSIYLQIFQTGNLLMDIFCDLCSVSQIEHFARIPHSLVHKINNSVWSKSTMYVLNTLLGYVTCMHIKEVPLQLLH